VCGIIYAYKELKNNRGIFHGKLIASIITASVNKSCSRRKKEKEVYVYE